MHRKAAHLGIPFAGNFELTAKCNFNCRMCYVHDNSKPDALSGEDWLGIAKEARDAGMVFVLLTGGELFMDKDFKVERKVMVKVNDRPVRWLNELEYINGKIWANVYTSDEIVIINPKVGRVEGVIDCRGLLPSNLRTPDTDVLNGIAYNPETKKIYLTGKNWPKLYEVKLVE
jgi:glutamine cyclotransferase